MLKISEINSSGEVTTLKLEGRVVGPWVEEVQRCCEQVLNGGRRLTLDLSDVSFAERGAIVLFKELAGREVRLTNCQPLLNVQLKEVGLRCSRF